MSTIARTFMALFTVLLLVIGGCKKTAEGEQAAWKGNVAQVNELIAQYPGFKPALQARLEKAEGLWKDAESLSDDAQIEKMAEANTTLMKDFVGELKALDKKMSDLRQKRVDAAAKAGDESTRAAAKMAADDAQKALDRAEATLKSGAADESAAAAVLKKVNADLDTALAAIKKVTDADKSKKEEAKAEGEAKAAADAKEKADADAKVAPWKCEYCNAQNPPDKTACEACGAPRGETKK